MRGREGTKERVCACVRACVRGGGEDQKINKTNKEGVVVVVVCVCVCGRACVCVRARGERHPRAQLIERGRERVVRDGERTPCQEAFFLVCVFVIVGAFAPTHPHTDTLTRRGGAEGGARGDTGQATPCAPSHSARPPARPPDHPPFLSSHTHTHTHAPPPPLALSISLSLRLTQQPAAARTGARCHGRGGAVRKGEPVRQKKDT